MEDQPYLAGVGTQLLAGRGINQLRFRQAEMLLGEGCRLIDETGRTAIGGGLFLLTAQVTRVAHTFEAVLATCRLGRGVQASMMNRALFEDLLDVHWVAANLESAPERADQHDRLMALAEHDLESSFGRTDRPLTDEERVELDDLVEIYGGRGRAFKASWTRTPYPDRLSLVQSRWEDEPEARHVIEVIYEVIQRQNNLLLHSSPSGFRQTITSGPDGRHQLNRAGPDGRWREALIHGSGAFYMSGRVLAQVFGFDKEDMAEAFSQTTNFLRSVSEFEGIDRLQPDAECPCGSTLGVSRCHLS
ncbi:MAG: hypothetical protein JSS97_00840 [Actinobacteria bacterium]|nr:hypothetical protein [Actinomycetota bacterium]